MAGTPPPGPGVDARGVPVIDPTQNVIALVKSGLRRQDDLRKMESENLRRAMKMTAKNAARLRKAEAGRLDALRAGDLDARARAEAVAAAQAKTLADQLATTATTFAQSIRTTIDPLAAQIAELQRTQFLTAGAVAAKTEGRDSREWAVGTIISVILAVVAVLTLILIALSGHIK